MTREQIHEELDEMLSREKSGEGNPRIKEVVNRLLKDLFYAMVDLDITSEEMWHAADYLKEVGQNNEWGLLYAGLGIERFMDAMMEHEDKEAGLKGVTPRTIEGPLYVAGSPISKFYAELENNPEENKHQERLYVHGTINDVDDNPVEGALLEVWHCNDKGLYSYFDKDQSAYNFRRGMKVGADGKFKFKTVIPPGYACPPGSATERMMTALGRHSKRPAHIHFFVSHPDYRKLTTQINIEGDPLTYEDFAFATKEELVPPIKRYTKEEAAEIDIDEAFAEIEFNFHIVKKDKAHDDGENNRTRALAENE